MKNSDCENLEKSLQEEIYEIWRDWKEDKLNRSFYDTYVGIIVGEYPEQQKYYLDYWESLKKSLEDEEKLN